MSKKKLQRNKNFLYDRNGRVKIASFWLHKDIEYGSQETGADRTLKAMNRKMIEIGKRIYRAGEFVWQQNLYGRRNFMEEVKQRMG